MVTRRPQNPDAGNERAATHEQEASFGENVYGWRNRIFRVLSWLPNRMFGTRRDLPRNDITEPRDRGVQISRRRFLALAGASAISVAWYKGYVDEWEDIDWLWDWETDAEDDLDRFGLRLNENFQNTFHVVDADHEDFNGTFGYGEFPGILARASEAAGEHVGHQTEALIMDGDLSVNALPEELRNTFRNADFLCHYFERVDAEMAAYDQRGENWNEVGQSILDTGQAIADNTGITYLGGQYDKYFDGAGEIDDTGSNVAPDSLQGDLNNIQPGVTKEDGKFVVTIHQMREFMRYQRLQAERIRLHLRINIILTTTRSLHPVKIQNNWQNIMDVVQTMDQSGINDANADIRSFVGEEIIPVIR